MCVCVCVCVCVCDVCVCVFSLRRTRARGSTGTNETGFYLLLGNLVFRPRITADGERAFIIESRGNPVLSLMVLTAPSSARFPWGLLPVNSVVFWNEFGLRWRQQQKCG